MAYANGITGHIRAMKTDIETEQFVTADLWLLAVTSSKATIKDEHRSPPR